MFEVSPFEAALVGHLLGDFILQNDTIADSESRFWKGGSTLGCLFHVLMYTAAVVLCMSVPMWLGDYEVAQELRIPFAFGLAIPHFCIDRFQLARKFMRIAGQEGFATKALSPWSVVVVDQVFHALCIYALFLYF